MERLTFEGNFCDIAQCKEIPCPYNGECSQRKVWERLKAYEDTHMMPSDVTSMRMDMAIIAALFNGVDVDRMKELSEADKDERVVVLPCKVGDRLYEVTGRKTISVYRVKAIRVELFVVFIEWDLDEGFVWQSLAGVSAGEIGKTVFLTREEAEKALEAME